MHFFGFAGYGASIVDGRNAPRVLDNSAMVYENALNIYTDGSSYSHPRRGGIGIRFVTIDELGNEVIEDDVLTGHQEATNNQMELMACLKALERAEHHDKLRSVAHVVIFTDSLYVVENVSRAIFQWCA